MQDEKFQIKERALGPGRLIDYFDNDRCLTFFGEPIIDGFAIRVPPNRDWKALCEREDATWAIDQREIIVVRLIEEMRNRYKTDDVTLDDDYWITVHFAPLLNLRGLS
jgi:hypothetical protein